jgi:hypothetical protein
MARGISFSKPEVETVIACMELMSKGKAWKPTEKEKKKCGGLLKKFQDYLDYMEKVGYW